MPSLLLLLSLFLPMPKELRPQDIVKPRDKHREEDLFLCRRAVQWEGGNDGGENQPCEI